MSDYQPVAPPVPATVDLRGFPYMPLDVVRLRDSEIAVKTKGDEFRCAVLLWCAAWHQVPAASLPDDDTLLAGLAGFGRVVREWKRIKAGALRGFVKCTDGRLYHPVVAEKAIEAWRAQLQQRYRTECARIRKEAQRKKIKDPEIPDFELWITRECPEAAPYLSIETRHVVPEDTPVASQGHPPLVPLETGSNRTEGKGRDLPSTSTLPESKNVALAVDNPQPREESSKSKPEPSPSSFRGAGEAAERVLNTYAPHRKARPA